MTNADPYALSEAASQSLRRNSADSAARAHYVAALRALGLHAAARRFSPVGAGSDAGGQIAWASRRRRFAANSRAAVERWPHLAALEALWEANAEEFELHQCADGNYQILKRSIPEMWRAWMGGLLNHKGQIASWAFDRNATPVPAPLAFDGVGHGWFFLRVAEATERSFLSYSCALYVLEPDPIALCILFHLHDVQGILRHPRLRLFAASGAGGAECEVLDEFAGAVRANPTWSIPQQFVTCRISANGVPELQATCEGLFQERKSREEQLLADVNARYAARDMTWWRARFDCPKQRSASGVQPSGCNEATLTISRQPEGWTPDALFRGRPPGPLRILAITTRYSTVLRWSMEELAMAIRAAGHEVEIVIEPDDQSLENSLAEKLHAFDPDLLVLLSRMRHENPSLPRRVPALTWDQDNLPCMRTAETTASLDAFTYVAGHGAVYGQIELGWPAKNCIPCFPAAAAHRYQPRRLTDDETARYAADFSYISNASGSPEFLRDQLARQWSGTGGQDLFHRLAEDLIARSRAGERWDTDGLNAFVTAQAGGAGVALSPEARHELAVGLRTLADRCFRHATLEWVARFCREEGRTLKLYGTGWETHPTLAAHACGRVDPGDSLTAITLATRINLQIIESGLIHSRFLDGVAAGGFFLARESLLPGERTLAEAQHTVARRLDELGGGNAEAFASGAAIAACADDEVRRMWGMVGGLYADATPRRLAAVLRIWREFPPHTLDMPHSDAITFGTEETFRTLAARYLADANLRTRIAADLREHVLARHSYDARWRQFLAAIREGLQ